MSTRVDQAQQVNIAKPVAGISPQETSMPNSIMVTEGVSNTVEQTNLSTRRNNIYALLIPLCEEYGLDLNDLKEMNCLEQMLGCNPNKPEELAQKSEEEIVSAIRHLELAWKNNKRLNRFCFWRDEKSIEESIVEILKSARDIRTRENTGVNRFGQAIFGIGKEETLQAELIKRGFLKEGEPLNDQALINYFQETFLQDIETKPYDKQVKIYTQAFKAFGKLLLTYNTEEEAKALTSVIQLLAADKRLEASKLTIQRFSNDLQAMSNVALQNHSHNVENMYGMDENDAIALAALNIDSMTTPARQEAIEMTRSLIENLQNIAPEDLNEAQRAYLDKNINYETAGAISALAQNSEYDLINTAIENAKDAGVNNDLIGNLLKEYFGGEDNPEYKQFKAALEVAQKKAENQTLAAGKVASSAAKASAAKVSTETTGSSREASRVISAVKENATNTSNPISTLVVNLFVNNQQAMALAKKDIVANAETILKSREENLPEVVSPTLDMYLNNGGTLKLYLNSKPNEMHSALKDAFNMYNRLNDEDKDLAIAYYAQLDEERQSTILQEVGNTALSILLKYASNKTLANLDKKDLNNSIAQHLFEQRKEQIQETSLA